MTRRGFGILSGTAFGSFVFSGACGGEGSIASTGANDGRLSARPRMDVSTSAKSGPIGLDQERDAILQLPASASGAPLPLLVLLHGAGGSGEGILRRLGAAAEDAGVAVLAPDSRGSTWDAVRDRFGRDVTFLDRALAHLFETVAVDPSRVAAGGFSDGASYALSLGLINGDLFRRVVAFSPGFVVDGTSHGNPRFFVSHGTADPILPIDRCSRVIVPALRKRGYEVAFREFDSGHQMPAGIVSDAMKWLASRP